MEHWSKLVWNEQTQEMETVEGPCPCTNESAPGYKSHSIVDLSEVADALNDILDKCNDIFEKVNE